MKGRVTTHDARHPRLPQEIQRRQKRQSEHREIVAVDALEQLNAETFELIGADACRRRAPTVSR